MLVSSLASLPTLVPHPGFGGEIRDRPAAGSRGSPSTAQPHARSSHASIVRCKASSGPFSQANSTFSWRRSQACRKRQHDELVSSLNLTMDSDSDASHDSQSSASSRSASPAQQSPSTSFHAEPSLQRLTTHFVNAKRSLSTTHHVFRANELVTSSRSLVEDIALLNARNEYAEVAAEDGVKVLEDVKWNIDARGDEAGADFTHTIEGLDEANGRLMKTLERLQSTVVDASLQRKGDGEENNTRTDNTSDNDAVSPKNGKTLLSFIDTSKHESLQESLRAQIDEFNTAKADLSSSLETFSSHIHVLHSMLTPAPPSPDPPELLRPALYDEPAPAIPQLFHTITENASTMASLLQSLVSHYDLCVTALKHTEGGGEAARRAVQQQQKSDSPTASDTLPKSQQNLEESLYRKDHASSISPEERKEMLTVLEHDSAELDDVISELTSHATDLESAFDQLSTRARKARERDKTLRRVVTMLREMHAIHLPSHQHSLRTFEQDWSRIRSVIVSSTAQLSDLSAFYADFLAGYKKLLREIERRKAAENQMRRIAEKAEREIGRVYEADAEAREGFMREVGGVLPGDLWPALLVPARRWGVVELEYKKGQEEGE